MMFPLMLIIIMSPTACGGNYYLYAHMQTVNIICPLTVPRVTGFSPQSRTELQGAVKACLQLSSRGACPNGRTDKQQQDTPIILGTDTANDVLYRTMVPSDVDSVVPVVAKAFHEGEPVSGALGATLADFLTFCRMFVPRMAKEGNTILAISTASNEVLGAFLNEGTRVY